VLRETDLLLDRDSTLLVGDLNIATRDHAPSSYILEVYILFAFYFHSRLKSVSSYTTATREREK